MPALVLTAWGLASIGRDFEVLTGDGVPADAVVLAHVDRSPDPVLHADLAAAGAYLGYDTFARAREQPESQSQSLGAGSVQPRPEQQARANPKSRSD